MATDPPAASVLPEIADLDPAFDLTTFATERNAGPSVSAPATARVSPRRALDRDAPAPVGVAAAETDDLHRSGWLTDSAIQVAIAVLLVFGAVAIVIVAVRGRQASPGPAAAQQPQLVQQPQPVPAAAASKQPAVPPAPAPRRAADTTAARSRESKTAAAPAPSRSRHTAPAPVSTSGTTARRPATARPLPGAALSKTPPAAAPTVIQHAMLNVNARPWATVWLDGRPVGETPLANLRVPVGEHELIFRHPDLGERRVVAVVGAGGTTRVTVDLRD